MSVVELLRLLLGIAASFALAFLWLSGVALWKLALALPLVSAAVIGLPMLPALLSGGPGGSGPRPPS